MASTTNDGGETTAVSAPTDKAIITSSGTKTFHLPTKQAHDIPSRRPGEIFDFMALTGELRNAIYQAVIDTMATTPDNPIALSPRSKCIRKYDIWLRGCNECYCHFPDHWTAVEPERIPEEELAQIAHIAKLRTNLATCRLGEVSRQIRSEFVPMLLDSLHFRICSCGYIAEAPVHQLAGMIRHLDFYTHSFTMDYPYDDLPNLLNTLLTLRFNGELKIIGDHDHTRQVLDSFNTFCTSVRAGERRTEAAEKAFEVMRRLFQLLYAGLNDPFDDCKQIMTFRFNYNDFLGNHVQT